MTCTRVGTNVDMQISPSGQAGLIGGWLRGNEIKNDAISDNAIALGEV